MPRVIVQDDREKPVLDEYASSVILRNEHSAAQLLQRIGWAVEDAHRKVRKNRPLVISDYKEVDGC